MYLLRSYFLNKYSYNFKMSHAQQNKQLDSPKRIPNLKFLSIKSVLRNKKIIVKKTIPAFTIYPRNGNTYSTSDLLPNNRSQQKEQTSHRGFSLYKPSLSGINTNIITIKFGEEKQHLHKSSQKKIRRKVTNNFNFYGEDQKKIPIFTKDKAQSGAVQDSLIIQPLQKLENHYGWDRRKGFYNFMLITKKSKNEGSNSYLQTGINTQQTIKDLKQFGKQITQTQFMPKKRSSQNVGIKLQRVTTSFLKSQPRHEQPNEQKQSKTLQLTPARTVELIDPDKQLRNKQKQLEKIRQKQIQKARQRELFEALLKQYRQLLPKKVNNSKNYFVFGMSQKLSQPQNKIELYRDFLWKINYSNGLFVFTPQNIDCSYKAFIGSGNNSCMVKSILRRRGWWMIVDSSQLDSCNFVWTQLKINSLFKTQSNRLQRQMSSNQIQQIIEQINQQQESQENQQNQYIHKRIFNARDLQNWQKHIKRNSKTQQKLTQQTQVKRLKLFAKKRINKVMDSQKLKIHNHLQFNFFLGNKKALFYNIKSLCDLRNQNPFDYIPLTFHLSKGIEDPAFQKFLNYYIKFEEIRKVDKNFKNIWICKPGQNTNRGNGISVCSGLDDIKHRLRGKQKNGDGKPRTFILQKYIQRPFLYKNRKFDIRHYMLLTCLNGNIKAYWFEQGYIRTSSSIFNLKNANDLMIHLTNDAVQKKGDSYGKHQKGNKVSYEEFQKYLDTNYKKKYDFVKKTLHKMKKIALTAVQATFLLLDPNRKQHNFQLIGLDFMIDQDFRPWLIQANTNPCLQLSSPLLQKLIPSVIQQTFRICVDPFFPPPENCSIKNKFYGQNALLQNRFELIFDQSVDGDKITRLIKQKEQQGHQFDELIGKVEEDNELFEDDGNQNWQQKNTN